MKTFPHLWQYLSKFLLKWEMFKIKVVENIKIHILCSVMFFWKPRHLWDNVEKYGVPKGVVNDVKICRIWFACWISKPTYTHEHAHAHAPGHPHTRARTQTHTHTHVQTDMIFIAFPRQRWFAQVSQCYVTRTFPVLLFTHVSGLKNCSETIWVEYLTVLSILFHSLWVRYLNSFKYNPLSWSF